jgi:hypothetical protein
VLVFCGGCSGVVWIRCCGQFGFGSLRKPGGHEITKRGCLGIVFR